MDYKAHKQLEFRRKFWQFLGASIKITDQNNGEQIGLINLRALKLREDIRVYSGTDTATEIFRIHARNILDLSAIYDVFDGTSETPLFSLRRQGLKSAFVRDHWDFLGSDGSPIGEVVETSGTIALVRRWLGFIPIVGELFEIIFAFVPQTYNITDKEQKLMGTLAWRKNPLFVRLLLDTTQAVSKADPRMAVSVAALLCVVDEGKN